MADSAAFLDALHGIAARVDEGMSEKDVENSFLNEGFYDALGYEGAGYDVRSEWTLPDDRRPDYVTLDDNEAVTAVYEFKTTGRGLGPHEDQLFHYVDSLKADYGVLTNGEELRLYEREGRGRLLTISLADVSESDARDLVSALDKPEWDITDPGSVNEYLVGLDSVALDDDLGQDHFFDTFRLEDGSPFADLVTALMDLLAELRDEREAKFVKGAYDFWEASYASVPDEIPDSWEPFTNGEESLMEFMFCLESGHALLARLLLAKATEDHDFFPPTKGLRRYFDEMQGFSDRIDLDAYPVAATGLIEDMHDQLVQSLFEDDIFIWWTDAFEEETTRLHANPYNRFQEVAQEGSQVTRVSQATKERFSRAVAHVLFSVLKFDFSAVEGDPLGDLYQRYFDPETRKALGEFYTPQPIIEYIMDGVGYNTGVSNERLIDPSCGSGTFLVEAVERYLDDVRRYNDDPDWEDHLTELCSRPHIVGLDIHPFAVLMAQIRFMVAILPEYREAKRENPEFTLRRLPIFRTDSLQNERESAGADLGDDGWRQLTFQAMTEDNQDVLIPVPLPIEVDEEENSDVETDGGFLVRRVRMPLFDTIQLETGVSNFGEYFAALQGVLDVVKFHMTEDEWEYVGGLREGIDRYATREYEGIEEFFEPYVNDILETARYLREEHGDGRLFKIFEDSMLALVVKNYMEYEYVVGNPPYVSIKNIPDSNLEYYRSMYDAAFGRFDLYVLFIERGLELLAEDGKLGYITSNKFTRSKYGTEIRQIISTEYSLDQYVEFGDVDLFRDATNFASVIVIDRNRKRDVVRYAKVHEGRENVLREVRRHIDGDEVLTDSLEVSTYPLSELGEDNWRFTPAKVRNVARQIAVRGNSTVEDISLGVREGVASGGDDAFIVSPEFAEDRNLENELLRPIIRGENVRRWRVLWEKELAIYPYNGKGELLDLSDYPNVKRHLDNHQEYLKDRYCVRKGGKGIYEYHGPHAKSVFEGDFRIATPDMATENQFSFANGYNCFKNTVYVLTFGTDQPYSEECLLGYLNSSVAEFMVKQTSPPLRGKPFRYRYKTQYVNQIPLPESCDTVESIVNDILSAEETEQRTKDFPDAYIDEIDGEIEHIDYEWQTDRGPVNAEIQVRTDDTYAVRAGRTDSITAPQIDSEERARYVRAAVNGRNVEKGEETSIPIPRSDEDVRSLLDQLEADKVELKNTDIEELEAEIDRIVYDLFDLTEDEREVIEEYLEVF